MLLAHSEATPEAAASYCDITGFGDRETTITQPSVTGPAAGRQLALLHHHHSAVAFQGLTRTDAVRRAGGVRRNAVEDFSADTTFMAAIARAGELHRVPRALYRKRYHARNAHVEWSAWPLEKRAHGGVVHCADMLEQAILAGATLEERRTEPRARRRDCTCWLGGTQWKGGAVMRVSFSNWATTDADVDRSAQAIAASVA